MNEGSARSSPRAREPTADGTNPPETPIAAPEVVLRSLAEAVGVEVVGAEATVRLLYTALISGGHVLLEGAPGVAKTLLVRRFAGCLALGFKRVQFTPDMLPSDIIGSVALNPMDRVFEYRPGPIFTNIVLADEINRAPPKVQSALLESMQENQVTLDGVAHPLPRPFMVIATQNPIEHEGTYRLPEAELDRLLFRILIDYPTEVDEQSILRRHLSAEEPAPIEPVADVRTLDDHRSRLEGVFVAEDVLGYVARLVRGTREDPRILIGASPRAGVQLARAARAEAMLSGRSYVLPDDVKRVAFWVLNHRVALQPEVLTEGFAAGQGEERILFDVIAGLLERIPAPR